MICHGNEHAKRGHTQAEFIVIAVKLAPAFASVRTPLCASCAGQYLRMVAGNLIAHHHGDMSTLTLSIRRIDSMSAGEATAMVGDMRTFGPTNAP